MGFNLPENADSALQRDILDSLPVLVFLERAGRIVFANAEARQMLGAEQAEAFDRPVEDVLWGLFPGAAEPQTLLTGSGSGTPFHATLLARTGRMQPIEGTYCVVNAEPREAVIVAHPGGRERAPRSRLLEDVLASIPEAVVIVHQDHLLYTNPSFTRMFGFSADEVAGGDLREFIVPETRMHEIATITHGVDQNGRVAMETVRKTNSGELVDVALLAGPLIVNGTRVGYAISYRDIGERKQIEARLQHDAMHDVLTGLPNRALFLDRLAQAFSRRVRRRELVCGVLLIDLDDFKNLNDSLGHAAGDTLLMTLAERLRGIVRPQDTAARLGGDHFAVLVEGVLSIADIETIAARVSDELEQMYSVYGHPIRVGASIGVAMARPDHENADALLRDADFAMSIARQQGGSRFQVFDRRLERPASDQQNHEFELRQAAENRLFEIWYEPIYRLGDGHLEGFESKPRCVLPDGDEDSFRELLELGEETGFAMNISKEMANTVCKQLAEWRQSAPELTLGINFSLRQFYHPDLAAQLARSIEAFGAEPSRLIVEVPETTLTGNPEAAAAILERVAGLGVRVAVDDFGSGLAPVNYLVRLPIDVVKLDAKLTAAATAGGKEAALLEGLIRLGRSLGVKVVAQGIETAAQLEALRALGCVLGQGPLLSPAVTAEAAQRLTAQAHWPLAPTV